MLNSVMAVLGEHVMEILSQPPDAVTLLVFFYKSCRSTAGLWEANPEICINPCYPFYAAQHTTC